MQLFKLSLIFGLATLAAAGHHHGGGSSYSTVTKHEAPHHHGHYDAGHHGGDGGDGGDEGHGHGHHDYYSHPSYKFEYGVKDPHTGDNKNQWEHRDGDQVKGGYMLHDADGTTRVVEYTSDKHNGFNAVVKKIGHAHHPQVYGHHDDGHGHESHDAHGHGHDHGHGHASSYANVHQHHH